MNHSICPQARQRCPSPWACGEGCNFNNEVPKQSAQERAARQFTEMEFPIDMTPDAGDLAIAWFQRWAWWIAGACFVLAAVVTYFGRAV
jgi:hypothetical protein